jgi:hypothetical protein
MEGRTWLAQLGRWLQPVGPDVQEASASRMPLPAGTRLLESRPSPGGGPKAANILVAMVPHTGEPRPGERVHRGSYLVADPECCVLVGDEGVYFIPWDAIAWIKT